MDKASLSDRRVSGAAGDGDETRDAAEPFLAYQQQRMSDDSVSLTAFRTQYGMFESLVVRDGLKNAPPGFQTFLNQQFADLLGHGVIVYIDDIIVHAKTLERLWELTRIVMERLRAASLYLKAKKCLFEVSEVKFLGFIVNQWGNEANPEKIQALLDMESPKKLKDIQKLTRCVATLNRFIFRATDWCLPFFNAL